MRDQGASAFSGALLQLCQDTGASAAALVDSNGETVDYAGSVDPFEIKVAAAECRLLMAHLERSGVPGWMETSEIVVRSSQRSFAAFTLDAGYALVLCLGRRCFGVSPRALGEAVRVLSEEASLGLPTAFASAERWRRVDVRTAASDPFRPQSMWHEGSWCELIVLGRYRTREFRRRDRGYRARMNNGAEFFLIREPLGRWYAEDFE
jgi:hypothetical protein